MTIIYQIFLSGNLLLTVITDLPILLSHVLFAMCVHYLPCSFQSSHSATLSV